MLNAGRCAVAGTCPPSYSLWEGGSFAAVPTLPGLRFEGATEDLSHFVFSADSGLYEWSGGSLETLSATPGARLAAPVGAISTDGQRVYLSIGEDGPLYLGRPGGTSTPLPETSGGAAFQAASADGSVAFYTVGSTLYRYDSDGNASQPLGSGVIGVLGISAAGDVAYYQDSSGLERWQEGTTTTVLAGAGAALPTDYPPATGTARVSADGARLAFLSAARSDRLRQHRPDTG